MQRQLVEQNTSLKKEVAIAERKLIARNERILSLEGLLADSQEKLTAANHRYVHHSHHLTLLMLLSFESQLQAVKERLEAAKVSSRNLAAAPQAPGAFSLASAGARIAKPLRGGGGTADGNVNGASGLFSHLTNGDNAPGKRSSWFFQNRS